VVDEEGFELSGASACNLRLFGCFEGGIRSSAILLARGMIVA